MEEKRLDLFLNHLNYSQSNDHPIVDAILEKYLDEIRVFKQHFHEALHDDSVGAHAMLPTTPGARSRRGGKKATENISARPPPAGTRGKKRLAVGSKMESRRKRVSMVSATWEESSLMSDISLGSQAFDMSTLTSQLGDVEDSSISQTRPSRSIRPRRKKPPSGPDADTQNDTDTQLPEETARQRSRRIKKMQQLTDGVRDISQSATPRQQLEEGLVIEDLEINTPDVLPHPHPCSSIFTISPPERPAPPSSTFLESTLQSTPPAKPSPPLIISSQTEPIPGAPVTTRFSSSPALPGLSTTTEQGVSESAALGSNSEARTSPAVIRQDSLDQSHQTVAAHPGDHSLPEKSIVQKERLITRSSSPCSVKSIARFSSPCSVKSIANSSTCSVKSIANSSPCSVNSIARSSTSSGLQSRPLSSPLDIQGSPSLSSSIITRLSTHPDIQTTKPIDAPISDKSIGSDFQGSPQPSGNTITHLTTSSHPDTAPKPPSNPISDITIFTDVQSSPQPSANITHLNTPSDNKSTINPSTDFYTPTHLSEEVFPPGKNTADTTQTAREICETPNIMPTIPLPTPYKTFSIQKHYDAGLYISPPSDHVNKTRKSSSRPVVESPLLEQYPGPSMLQSQYDHARNENTGTPFNPRPAYLPKGATHLIQKIAQVPTRINSPSKFHSKCSPQPRAPKSTNTPHMWTTKYSPNRNCKIHLSKNLYSSQASISPNFLVPSKPIENATRTNASTNQSLFLSPSHSITQPTNSSLQNIPRGLVSNLAGRFQINPHDNQPGKLALSVTSFLKKKPANRPVNTQEENRARIENKHQEDGRRVGGLIEMKQKMLDKKKQENTKRQQEAADRRAEITRKQQEKVYQKLDHKVEKMKQWEKQSMRKKKAEEERNRREENDRRRAEDKRKLEKSQTKSATSEPASTTFNTSSFMSTTQSHNDVTSYQIDDLDSENTDDEDNPRHLVPSWATEPFLLQRLRFQFTGSANPDIIFPSSHLLQPMELTLVFEYNRYRRCKRPYHYRTSSAHWTSPMGKTS